ncbi:MAG: hypothetical protein LBR37_03965 [Erysipelotrichaceae bacterium]|jgi:hypothetical protein|nr:hypothetical protein [Erysipelotrichaceae bacterium]
MDKKTFVSVASLDLRSGALPIIGNIVAIVLFVVTIVFGFSLFPFQINNENVMIKLLLEAFLGIICALVSIFFIFLIKFVTLKIAKAGKVRVHLGLFIDVYSENQSENHILSLLS